MSHKLGLCEAVPVQHIVAVLCSECGSTFTCIEDSVAHKLGRCNHCWAALVSLYSTDGVAS